MASGPEGTETLKHKTSVLRVSIHCEGCKKKVKKVLQRVEGVYTIDIDSKQNKVIVTGSADAESLIRKLLKYGKHAELWPETKPVAPNSSSAPPKSSGDSIQNGKEKTPVVTATPPETERQLLSTEKKQQAEEGKPTPPPPTEGAAAAKAVPAAAVSGEASASKHNINVPKNDASEEPVKSESPPAVEVSDDMKEKGKKVQRELISEEERTVTDSYKDASRGTSIASMSPPPPHRFPAYPQPVYTMSYSAVQPSISYSYYVPSQEVVMSSSYTAYSGYPPPPAYPPENYSTDSYYSSMTAPEGSYDMFNDENPNACNLM